MKFTFIKNMFAFLDNMDVSKENLEFLLDLERAIAFKVSSISYSLDNNKGRSKEYDDCFHKKVEEIFDRL